MRDFSSFLFFLPISPGCLPWPPPLLRSCLSGFYVSGVFSVHVINFPPLFLLKGSTKRTVLHHAFYVNSVVNLSGWASFLSYMGNRERAHSFLKLHSILMDELVFKKKQVISVKLALSGDLMSGVQKGSLRLELRQILPRAHVYTSW